MQMQWIQCHRQAPGGKLSETLSINLIKTNINLKKPWKAAKHQLKLQVKKKAEVFSSSEGTQRA